MPSACLVPWGHRVERNKPKPREVLFVRSPHWFLFSALSLPSLATAWPNSPLVNVPVCTAPQSQQGARAVEDGAGGAIVAWEAYGSGGIHGVFSQHLLASGVVDPAWPADGAPLCSALYGGLPAIASDGAGGATVTWTDARTGNYDVYAQRILASGEVDPAWPADGLPVCVAGDRQGNPTIVSDGQNGAIITWEDFRDGSDYDVYAQRVLASGTVDPGWPVNGRALCTSAYQQSNPRIVPDDSGGAIVTWRDSRSLTDFDPYVQRIDGAGAVLWTLGGVRLCSNPSDQYWPDLVPDGKGGAIVVWNDYRNGAGDIYAQRVNPVGNVQWTVDGVVVCDNPLSQSFFFYSQIASDRQGGVIVSWVDAGDLVRAQRVSGSGARQWSPTGVALCTAPSEQGPPFPIPDGAGGAIVAWVDLRVPNPDPDLNAPDIYAQRVRADGTVDWPLDGLAICAAEAAQDNPTLIPDQHGGVIAFWDDGRNGWSDIYAQRVDTSGVLGEPVVSVVEDRPAGPDLSGVWPNPVANHWLRIRFVLTGTSVATLELLDVMGRVVEAREVGSLGAGEHTVELRSSASLAPGLYLVRLRTEGAVRTRSVTVLGP